MYGEFIDIPELEKLPDQERARETERALKELAGNINRTLEQIETKIKRMETLIGEKRK